ncbi:MAG: DUF4923 family protein [Prevotella sp.]|nr:DUF4923 family protein [Prevotella sp.]MBQ4295465.1 DUF4923 family protein [Prevotella sp.]
MKKRNMIAMAVAAIMMAGCGGMGTGTGADNGILNGVDASSALGNILGSVLGINKVSETTILGTWKYAGPGCAFTSDNLLAKAGGEVAAQKVKAQLQSHYSSLGLNSSNTYISFKEDKTFSGKVDGKTLSGTYTLDVNTGQITLKTLLLTMNGYVNLNTTGMSLLFESQKLLTILQGLGALSGNTTMSAVGELSKNYKGVRIGFDMAR